MPRASRIVTAAWAFAAFAQCGGFPSHSRYLAEGLIAYNLLTTSSSTCQVTGGATNCPLSISGVVTSLATVGLSAPNGLTCDGTNLYVADTGTHRILKVVIATGAVSLVAGSGTAALVNGTGAAAQFTSPRGITTDGTNLFVADTNNHAIRQILLATAVVTTLAGNGVGAFANGTGAAAQFNFPAGIVTDGTNLYVGDTDNQRIRTIVISTAAVTSLAGSGVAGHNDAAGALAQFNFLRGLTTDGTSLYLADTSNHRIRKIVISSATASTLAGTAASGSTDGTGAGAQFFNPNEAVTDGTNLYIADGSNNSIRKLVLSTGAVTTLVTGLADPRGITTDGQYLYVADTNNNRIIRIQ